MGLHDKDLPFYMEQEIVAEKVWVHEQYNDDSGVTRIFRPVGKFRLCRKKKMGKMGKVLIDGPNKVLIT